MRAELKDPSAHGPHSHTDEGKGQEDENSDHPLHLERLSFGCRRL